MQLMVAFGKLSASTASPSQFPCSRRDCSCKAEAESPPHAGERTRWLQRRPPWPLQASLARTARSLQSHQIWLSRISSTAHLAERPPCDPVATHVSTDSSAAHDTDTPPRTPMTRCESTQHPKDSQSRTRLSRHHESPWHRHCALTNSSVNTGFLPRSQLASA